jgi:spore germination protein KA
MKLSTNNKINIKKLENINGKSPDLVIRTLNKKISYAFFESVSSDNKISDFLNKALINVNYYFDNVFNKIKSNLYNSKVKDVNNFDELYFYLESGFTIVFINGFSKALAVETRETLDRGITDVKSEMGIKGPRDSFTENFNKNLGLIRKRIKNQDLKVCEYLIGRRSKTKVGLLYIEDIVFIDNVNEIKKKLSEIDIDAILDTGYIRDFLIDKKNLFPTIINSERPDLVCASLLEGKIAIIVDNTPYVLVIPGFLNNFIHASEDSYQNAFNVTFTRILRLIAFLITILVPAFYVAITTFNQEVIPDTLLISLAIQRSGVPFPTSFAVLIFMITFEMLRESDIRLPEKMGTSISIVGALVLGDAAVNAGIVSPIVVIVVAISSITGLLFTDTDIINALRFWKFFILLFSATMGLVGFIVASLILITNLCSIEVIGLPYLIPFSPLNINALKDSLFMVSRNKMKKRANYLTNNIIRIGDKNEK